MPHESVSVYHSSSSFKQQKIDFQNGFFFESFPHNRSAEREMIQLTHLVTQLNFTSADNLSGRARCRNSVS